jgi:hypothetical protein
MREHSGAPTMADGMSFSAAGRFFLLFDALPTPLMLFYYTDREQQARMELYDSDEMTAV